MARRWGIETLHLPTERGNERVASPTSAVVVGGGIAGVAAATILTERGVGVTLLEAQAHLGGRAGAFTAKRSTGEPFEMERGFHAFFRQYYNLRAILRRIDPELSFLRPLPDYPILGPNGEMQSFADLPSTPPFHIMSLVRRTPYLKPSDLLGINKREAVAMLAFDMVRTYRKYDGITAKAYLDSLGFPAQARQMLFDVFAHSFFNPEEEMSAGELLMMFHFYFTANPEGLVFDVADDAFSTRLWTPFAKWLTSYGTSVQTGVRAMAVERCADAWRVVHSEGEVVADLVVLALDVDCLRRLVEASPDLHEPVFERSIKALTNTLPFAVLRLWMTPAVAPERAPFVGTTGAGILDNISIYEKLEAESATWAKANGGSVVELHAYAVPTRLADDPKSLRKQLLAGLHGLYPETKSAQIVDEHLIVAADCPAFPPRSHGQRPTVETPFTGLALAGDFVRMPIPCALMERAAASGILAANTLVAPLGVVSEPIYSVPRKGLFASPFALPPPAGTDEGSNEEDGTGPMDPGGDKEAPSGSLLRALRSLGAGASSGCAAGLLPSLFKTGVRA